MNHYIITYFGEDKSKMFQCNVYELNEISAVLKLRSLLNDSECKKYTITNVSLQPEIDDSIF